MGLMEQLRAKYEIYRLEQRYARRDKRKTYTTGAVYVDGEYVYRNSPMNSPTTSTASDNSWGSNTSRSAKRRASIKVQEMIGRRI